MHIGQKKAASALLAVSGFLRTRPFTCQISSESARLIPKFTTGKERYVIDRDATGKPVVIDRNPEYHPQKQHFAFPPASEAQLQETEAALGFALPPVLRLLYSEVANGGFGPGHGIIGTAGGFGEAGTIIEGYQFHARYSSFVELAEHQRNMGVKKIFQLPHTSWPRHLLYLCDWGFATTSCIDCSTGKIFQVRPSPRDLYYTFRLEARMLEQWLEIWLNGNLKDRAKYIEGPADKARREQLFASLKKRGSLRTGITNGAS